MQIQIDVAFTLEKIVYLKTDPDQLPRMITAYTITPGKVRYELSSGSSATWHDAI